MCLNKNCWPLPHLIPTDTFEAPPPNPDAERGCSVAPPRHLGSRGLVVYTLLYSVNTVGCDLGLHLLQTKETVIEADLWGCLLCLAVVERAPCPQGHSSQSTGLPLIVWMSRLTGDPKALNCSLRDPIHACVSFVLGQRDTIYSHWMKCDKHWDSTNTFSTSWCWWEWYQGELNMLKWKAWQYKMCQLSFLRWPHLRFSLNLYRIYHCTPLMLLTTGCEVGRHEAKTSHRSSTVKGVVKSLATVFHHCYIHYETS